MYSVLTLVLGWWGFPWGPIYTLGALGRNALGGERPDDLNADLLAAVGEQLLHSGSARDAAEAFRASLAHQNDPAVRHALLQAEAHSREGAVPSGATPPAFRPGDAVLPVGEDVRLYAEAGGHAHLGDLPPTPAIVLRSANGWTELRVPGGVTGWVPQKRLAPVERGAIRDELEATVP